MIDISNIYFREISFGELMQLGDNLTHKHWDEAGVKVDKDQALDIDVVTLYQLENQGSVYIVGAFDSSIDKLVGYAAFIIVKNLFTSGQIANSAALYVAPEYRDLGIAGKMIVRAELDLVADDIKMLRVSLKADAKSLHGSMSALDYELDELTYRKFI